MCSTFVIYVAHGSPVIDVWLAHPDTIEVHDNDDSDYQITIDKLAFTVYDLASL